jgi:PTS system beta-glucosides-specific IIC component
MGLFDKLFQGNKIEISSPVKGEIVPITQVPDETFSQEMVGKGVAIVPSDGKFYAPADGELVALFPTGHAFCINSSDGAEILVHIGIDTVKLEGKYYTIHGKQGTSVKKGDLIVEVDIEGVKSEGYNVITPMIVSNFSKFSNLEKKSGAVDVGDAAIVLSK